MTRRTIGNLISRTALVAIAWGLISLNASVGQAEWSPYLKRVFDQVNEQVKDARIKSITPKIETLEDAFEWGGKGTFIDRVRCFGLDEAEEDIIRGHPGDQYYFKYPYSSRIVLEIRETWLRNVLDKVDESKAYVELARETKSKYFKGCYYRFMDKRGNESWLEVFISTDQDIGIAFQNFDYGDLDEEATATD